MARNNFQFKSGEIEAYSRQLKQMEGEAGDLLNRLDKSMQNIFSNSEGKTIDAFNEEYLVLQQNFKGTIKIIDDFSEMLRKAAEDYEAVDAMNAQTVRNLRNSF
ncbi:MAG: WXG100 family type VII secretion target [Lachnospiraceae bacterium]|nr:WXG100 family type VII secretion target [Lachnospiraceae bacterium]